MKNKYKSTLKFDTFISIAIIFLLNSINNIPNVTVYIEFFLTGILALNLLVRNRIIVNGISLRYLLIILVSIASYYWASNPQAVISGFLIYMQATIVALVFYQYLIIEDINIIRIIKCFVFSAFILGLRMVLTIPLSLLLIQRLQIDYFGISANLIGAILSYAILFTIYIYYKSSQALEKFVFLVIGIFLFVTSLLTGSRKVIIVILTGISIYYLLKSVKWLHIIKNIFIVFNLTVILVYILIKNDLLYQIIGYRIESLLGFIINDSGDNSLYTRNYLITIAKGLFEMSPFIGIGFGNFSVISGTGLVAHNNYWELLCNLGLLGFLLYYIPLIVILMKSINLRIRGNQESIFLIIIIIPMLIADVATVSFYLHQTQIVLAIVFSLFHKITIQQRICKKGYISSLR